jgi:signal transduction histidine kinase
MLQQVFFDLMNNSIDAMPKGGEISVSVERDAPPNARPEEKNLIIKIRDSGEGIDEKTLAKIFDPFFTTKDEGKGTGLGLSTVFLILQRHNGNITVQSKEQIGTTFTITLPMMGKPV